MPHNDLGVLVVVGCINTEKTVSSFTDFPVLVEGHYPEQDVLQFALVSYLLQIEEHK